MKKPASPPPPACLALADGTVYRGHAFGARSVGVGEVCFNTSMSGYQEIVTDPSYAGQIVVMTYTQIGNVGVNPEDDEAARPFLSGFVVKELFERPSSWRARESLPAFLARHGVPGIAGLDTRALVRRIRDGGFQTGVISTDPAQQSVEALVERARKAPTFDGVDLVAGVTCAKPYTREGRRRDSLAACGERGAGGVGIQPSNALPGWCHPGERKRMARILGLLVEYSYKKLQIRLRICSAVSRSGSGRGLWPRSRSCCRRPSSRRRPACDSQPKHCTLVADRRCAEARSLR